MVRGSRETGHADAGTGGDGWPVPWQPVVGTEGGPLRWAEYLALRMALAVFSRLPESLLRPVLGGLARVARLVDRRHSAAARGFLRQALGDMSAAELEGRVLQAYRHLFRVVVDSHRLLRVPENEIKDHFDVQWNDEAKALIEDGRGCVLFTGHLGNWETATVILPQLGFRPFYAVGKPPKSRPLSAFIQRSREHWGARLLPRRGSMRDAPEIIRAGGKLGLLLDQRARKKPVLAPFFGRPARCDRSAGVLLRRLKVPVISGAFYMTERPLHYVLRVSEVIHPEELASASPEAIATRINRNLEELILAAPEQYFWLHDRYRDTPPSPEADPADGADGPLAGRGLPAAEGLSSKDPAPTGAQQENP